MLLSFAIVASKQRFHQWFKIGIICIVFYEIWPITFPFPFPIFEIFYYFVVSHFWHHNEKSVHSFTTSIISHKFDSPMNGYHSFWLKKFCSSWHFFKISLIFSLNNCSVQWNFVWIMCYGFLRLSLISSRQSYQALLLILVKWLSWVLIYPFWGWVYRLYVSFLCFQFPHLYCCWSCSLIYLFRIQFSFYF